MKFEFQKSKLNPVFTSDKIEVEDIALLTQMVV